MDGDYESRQPSTTAKCDNHVQFDVGGADSPVLDRSTAEELNVLQELLSSSNMLTSSPNSDEHNYYVPKCSSTSRVQKITKRQVFVELYDLDLKNDSVGGEWVESARWIKYEEDVEGADHHWGQPHVAFLSFHSLIQLRKCLAKGIVLLDLDAISFSDTCEHIVRAMGADGLMPSISERIVSVLKLHHKRVHERARLLRINTIGASVDKRSSVAANRLSPSSISAAAIATSTPRLLHDTMSLLRRPQPTINEEVEDVATISDGIRTQRSVPNVLTLQQDSTNRSADLLTTTPITAKKRSSVAHFLSNARSTFRSSHGDLFQYKGDILLHQLASGAEAVQVFAGSMNELKKASFVMVRLANAEIMDELVECGIPVRFVFVILGPELVDVNYHELGRSISTLMANKHFNLIAYEARDRCELVKAIDDFLNDSIVIPPGEVDSKRLLSGEEIRKALRRRRLHNKNLSADMRDRRGTNDEESGSNCSRNANGDHHRNHHRNGTGRLSTFI